MKILGTIDIYFLLLMLIQGFVLLVVDRKKFLRNKEMDLARTSLVVGVVVTTVSVALYIFSLLV